MLLAEIDDKMGTAVGTAILACFLATPALALGLWRRWLAVLAVPVVLFFNYGFHVEFTEPGFAAMIAQELGHGWVARQLIAFDLPFAIAFAVVLSLRRVYHGADQCRNCGYVLRGLTEPRCPECGHAFTPGPPESCRLPGGPPSP